MAFLIAWVARLRIYIILFAGLLCIFSDNNVFSHSTCLANISWTNDTFMPTNNVGVKERSPFCAGTHECGFSTLSTALVFRWGLMQRSESPEQNRCNMHGHTTNRHTCQNTTKITADPPNHNQDTAKSLLVVTLKPRFLPLPEPGLFPVVVWCGFMQHLLQSFCSDWHVPYATDKLITLERQCALTCLFYGQVLILSRSKHFGCKCEVLSSVPIIWVTLLQGGSVKQLNSTAFLD